MNVAYVVNVAKNEVKNGHPKFKHNIAVVNVISAVSGTKY